MRHPTEGVLRRLVDEPAGVSDPDREHVAGCAACLSALTAARHDAAAVASALDVPTDVDLDAAWERLSTGPARPSAVQGRTTARSRRGRDLLRRPAAAAVGVALVLTGASAAAANDWLQVFRTERVAALSLSAEDLLALPDLSAYGELSIPSRPEVHEVPDAATAAAESGLALPVVGDLPRGVTGEPTFQVGRQVTATFTFSTARATRAAADAGESLPTPPPGLDGTQLRLVAGPGAVQLWRSSQGMPALLVARAVAPSAFSSGVPLATARDYLLSLPALPDEVAAQLRAFTADGTTLPLPVPADQVRTSTTEVDGAPATLLEARDGTFGAVVWVEDGLLTVVAGSIDTDEALTVARELR